MPREPVQRLVLAEAAGVMFTIDPIGGAPDKVVISANWGLGDGTGTVELLYQA
jgi:phosphoenolpyruvate synthase/pyruvate phosphate dikinase